MAFDWKRTNEIDFWVSKKKPDNVTYIRTGSYGARYADDGKLPRMALGNRYSTMPSGLTQYLPRAQVSGNLNPIWREIGNDSDHIKLVTDSEADWGTEIATGFFPGMEFEIEPRIASKPDFGSYLSAQNLTTLRHIKLEGSMILSWVVRLELVEDTPSHFLSEQEWEKVGGANAGEIYKASYRWPY